MPTLPPDIVNTSDGDLTGYQLDQALAAFDTMNKAKAAATAARTEFYLASNKLNSAQIVAAQAQSRYQDLSIRAAQAQVHISRMAAQAYVMGGVGDMSLIASTLSSNSGKDKVDVVDGLLHAIQVAQYMHSMIYAQTDADLGTIDASTQASQAMTDALTQLHQAQDAYSVASRSLDAADAALTSASTFYVTRVSVHLQTSVGPDGCPTTAPAGFLRDDASVVSLLKICRDSVAQAATPQAALAIKIALSWLGAPYACGGVGRMEPMRFDCSSYVSRAYAAAGVPVAGTSWAPSTRDMDPWDGGQLVPHYAYVAPADARPGDLFLYDTGGSAYRHVVMMLADGFMAETGACGDGANVQRFWGAAPAAGHSFLVARRVVLPGQMGYGGTFAVTPLSPDPSPSTPAHHA